MNRGKKKKEPKKDDQDHKKGHAPEAWKKIDLSEPPTGPLRRTRTSMGTEEPEWPEGNEDSSVEDEGDISE